MEWPSKNYPSPDYLSSSRKRLAPQLIYKGGILQKWGKKLIVVADEMFFAHLPKLKQTSKTNAEIIWMTYGFAFDKKRNAYSLAHRDTRYTTFANAISTITTPTIGNVKDFMKYLQDRIDKGKTMGLPTPSELAPEVEPPAEIVELGQSK
jgi:hypothetical protein